MRILALDVGSKKIGVAITDINLQIITPLQIIKLEKFNGKKIFDKLQILLKEKWNETNIIVIGDPLNTNQKTRSFSYKYVQQIIRIFNAWTDWKIELYSETYSTQWSEKILKKIGFKSQKIKNRADSFAAAKILYDYLQEKKYDVVISFF